LNAEPILHENLPLLRTADSSMMDVLLADPQAQRWIVRRLADDTAVIMPGAFEALLGRLRKQGFTPRVEEG
jgi:hypothetical protein